MISDIWYRLEVKESARWDHDFEYVSGYSYTSYWREFEVVRATPKGVVLREWGTEYFVLGTARKQIAVPTKELAARDARIRRQRHVDGCKARLRSAERLLEEAMLVEESLK